MSDWYNEGPVEYPQHERIAIINCVYEKIYHEKFNPKNKEHLRKMQQAIYLFQEMGYDLGYKYHFINKKVKL